VGAFVRVNPREVQLISMWVDPRARGRGVARDLIRAVAGWTAARESTRVVLFVQEANEPAQALYRRAGFRATGDRAPGGGGRSAFKLVLAASVEDILR
jgi:ribosomal protein S18 acetylase RimI-like enzyme